MGRRGLLFIFKDGVLLFGESILKVDIPESEIRNIIFRQLEEEYPIEDDWPGLMKLLNANAVAIHYHSGEKELCVFNIDIIQQIIY